MFMSSDFPTIAERSDIYSAASPAVETCDWIYYHVKGDRYKEIGNDKSTSQVGCDIEKGVLENPYILSAGFKSQIGYNTYYIAMNITLSYKGVKQRVSLNWSPVYEPKDGIRMNECGTANRMYQYMQSTGNATSGIYQYIKGYRIPASEIADWLVTKGIYTPEQREIMRVLEKFNSCGRPLPDITTPWLSDSIQTTYLPNPTISEAFAPLSVSEAMDKIKWLLAEDFLTQGDYNKAVNLMINTSSGKLEQIDSNTLEGQKLLDECFIISNGFPPSTGDSLVFESNGKEIFYTGSYGNGGWWGIKPDKEHETTYVNGGCADAHTNGTLKGHKCIPNKSGGVEDK